MTELKSLCLAVVLLPLIAAVITGLFKKPLGKIGAHTLTISAVGLSFVCACFVFKKIVFDGMGSVEIPIYTWGTLGSTTVGMGFLIDPLSVLMMVVVTFVSWMVHIYTIGYMKGDPGYQRFFSYISAFTFGMLMLVMSNNFLQLFFGWEAVGLMSYLLIGFWYQRESAIFANLKAFLINRIGDMGFLIGIAATFYYFGSINYQEVFGKVEFIAVNQTRIMLFDTLSVSAITFICVCLFIGAMGKSAQMPLHVWLPDSMEGPTPISALIHAATMVTAGVFMIARMSPLYEYSDTALTLVLTIGAITCLLTGLLGIVQNDIKRIIAYSTLSQLGYMMTAMGASAYAIGIFHLMTHAFFKALLFLAAGSTIIAMHHDQDIWHMGDLRKKMPITYITMLVGSLALIGFPFFSGFYSKDLIIEAVGASNLPVAKMVYWVVLISVFITALYSFRLFFVVFHGKPRMDAHAKAHIHESPAVVWWPLVLLAIPSLFIGGIFVEPLFENFFQKSIVVHGSHPAMEHLTHEFQGSLAMGVQGLLSWPFFLGLLGIAVAWLCYLRFPEFPLRFQKTFSGLYFILKQKYGFDIFYETVVMRFIRGIGFLFWRLGDQWAIDGIAVNGSARSVGRLALRLRKWQTGYLYHYAFTMITGFLILVIWLMLA